MFASASVTIGHSAREIRPTRAIRTTDGDRHTVRVRPGRSTARRAAINASLGYGR